MVPFTTRSERHAGVDVLAISGDLDLATKRSARSALQRALAGADQALVLDLSGIEFLDSTGLSVLIHTASEARATQRGFALVLPPGVARQTVEIAHIDAVVPV